MQRKDSFEYPSNTVVMGMFESYYVPNTAGGFPVPPPCTSHQLAEHMPEMSLLEVKKSEVWESGKERMSAGVVCTRKERIICHILRGYDLLLKMVWLVFATGLGLIQYSGTKKVMSHCPSFSLPSPSPLVISITFCITTLVLFSLPVASSTTSRDWTDWEALWRRIKNNSNK